MALNLSCELNHLHYWTRTGCKMVWTWR